MQSRLDMSLASAHMLYDRNKVHLKLAIKSDQSIIKISFDISEVKQCGRGCLQMEHFFKKGWRITLQEFNTVKAVLTKCMDIYIDVNDNGLLWNIFKCEIRAQSISYASRKATQENVVP